MDKLRMESPDMTAQNIDRIAALFPNCITEASDGQGGIKRAVNFELLKQMLSPDVVDGDALWALRFSKSTLPSTGAVGRRQYCCTGYLLANPSVPVS